MHSASEMSVDGIVALLASGDARPLSPDQPVTQLGHALQTAAILRRDRPDDIELAVAGLVHDIGQLLPGGTDETHAVDGAAAVQVVLGERVAAIVALHVEAKRYLVATDSNYKERLAADSVVSLGRQGGASTSGEVSAFLTRAWASDALTLRRADDSGKVVRGLGVAALEQWVSLLRKVSEKSGGANRPPRDERGD
ncbi:MAG TPA: inositol oxygenase family protein [Acidimicrobiales bacterium]|nr:inositol oxygenase family protein [Acidimicrobiales bacterium]